MKDNGKGVNGNRFSIRVKNDLLVSLLTAIILNIVLFMIFFAFVHPYFDTNDDVTMMNIASGALTGQASEYLIFMNIVFGKFLKFMYNNFGGINWYTYILYFLHFISSVIISFCFLYKKGVKGLFGYLAVFFGAEIFVLTAIQFTTAAFVTGLSGIILLYTINGFKIKGEIILYIISAFMIVISSLIRLDSLEMLILLSCILFIPRLFAKIKLKTYITLAGAGLACLLLLLYNSYSYQRDPQWKSYLEFNSARANITDYTSFQYNSLTKPVYDKVNWGSLEVNLFRGWYFADSKVFPADKVQYVSENISKALTVKQIGKMLIDSVFLLSKKQIAFIFLLFLYMLYQRPGTIHKITGITISTALVGVYLAVSGRLPVRILLCLVSFWITAAAYFIDFKFNKFNHRFKYIRMALNYGFLAMIVICWLVLFKTVMVKGAEYKQLQDSYSSQIMQMIDRGSVYVTWGAGLPLQNTPPFEDPRKYANLKQISLGWLVGSKHFQQELDRYDISNFGTDIINRKDICLIVGNKGYLQWFKEYVKKYYNKKIDFQKVKVSDNFNGYVVIKD